MRMGTCLAYSIYDTDTGCTSLTRLARFTPVFDSRHGPGRSQQQSLHRKMLRGQGRRGNRVFNDGLAAYPFRLGR